MKEKFRVYYDNNRIWLYVAQYVTIAVLLLVVVLLIDMRIVPVIDYIPNLFLTSLDLAKSILSTLAGALLTITTFTFTTTMAVLTTYSSNYSPRVVENFLQQKSTMKVLGIFAGGFVYCICSLFFMRNVFSDYRILSAGVAILYSVWCVVQFVFFIFSVANAVQVQNLIAGLYEEARDLIDRFVEASEAHRADTYDVAAFDAQFTLNAPSSGYLEIVDGETIQRVLGGKAYALVLCARIGDFVCKGQPLAVLHHPADKDCSDEEKQELSQAFNLQSKRFTIQDYRFAIQKISDIALRAVSPGINDPITAVSCIQSLGLLTGRLSQIDGIYAIVQGEAGENPNSSIIIEDYNFKADLYSTYSPIVHYGKGDIQVVMALLNAIHSALWSTTEGNRQALLEMADYIYESAVNEFPQAMDHDHLQARYEALKDSQ